MKNPKNTPTGNITNPEKAISPQRNNYFPDNNKQARKEGELEEEKKQEEEKMKENKYSKEDPITPTDKKFRPL